MECRDFKENIFWFFSSNELDVRCIKRICCLGLLNFSFVYVCMPIWVWFLWRPEEGARYLAAECAHRVWVPTEAVRGCCCRYRWFWGAQREGWATNSGSLQEQYLLLTTEPFLYPSPCEDVWYYVPVFLLMFKWDPVCLHIKETSLGILL